MFGSLNAFLRVLYRYSGMRLFIELLTGHVVDGGRTRSFCQLGIFGTGSGHVSQELLVGVESRIACGSQKPCCINVALPMVACNDAALSPLVAKCQKGVLGYKVGSL